MAFFELPTYLGSYLHRPLSTLDLTNVSNAIQSNCPLRAAKMKVGAILSLPLLLAVADAKAMLDISGRCKDDEHTISTCFKSGGKCNIVYPVCQLTTLEAAKKFEECESPNMKYYGQCNQDKSGNEATKDACSNIDGTPEVVVDTIRCRLPNLSDTKSFVRYCDALIDHLNIKTTDQNPPKDENPPDDDSDGGDDDSDNKKSDDSDDSDDSDKLYVPFPTKPWFKKWPNDPIITQMGIRLDEEGCGKSAGNYKVAPGPQWTAADMKAYRCWQKKLGYRDGAADGWPGPDSWHALKVPLP